MKFNRMCKAMLNEENYIDTLGYIATRILSKKTIEAKENEVDRIDEILWRMVDNVNNCDASDNALRISTAMVIMLDECY